MKLETLIDQLQDRAELAEATGDTDLFELLDTAAYRIREMRALLVRTIPDVDNGMMQQHSQKLLSEINDTLNK